MTARMLAQRQPPFEQCVTADWSRDPAPKMIGSQASCRSGGSMRDGRGARHAREGGCASTARAHAGDYADMSNEKPGENPGRRNPKVSRGRFVRPGSAGT